MAFNPRSDVVQEVLNAADPARAEVAARRLNALADPSAPAADFAADLDKVANAAANPPTVKGMADARSQLAAASGEAGKFANAKTEFEAMMLTPFVSEMLPKDASDVFGQGFAGDMWRSMLAEQAARQIAKSGALGISKRLFATHELSPDWAAHPGEAAKTASEAAQMSANILSAPPGAEFDNGAVLFAGGKRT